MVFFFPFRIARFSGLFLFRFVWYNVGSFSTQDLSTADRSGRSVIPSLFLVSRATARPPSSVVSHPREFHLEFFSGTRRHLLGRCVGKGRTAGEVDGLGSARSIDRSVRPVPSLPFPVRPKRKKKKRRAVPLSWEMTRKLSVKEREQEEDEREREEICIYRECFCSCVLTPREGGGGLGGRIIREMTGLLFFSPHHQKKEKKKPVYREKPLGTLSSRKKKKGGEAKERKR